MTKPKRTEFKGVRMTAWRYRGGLRTLGRTQNGIRVMKKITDAMRDGNTVSAREELDQAGRTILDATIIWDANDAV